MKIHHESIVRLERAGKKHQSRRAGAIRLVGGVSGALAILLLGVAGCLKPQIRSQSEDENEKNRYPVKTVGDVTVVGNADPLIVGGVGLVIGLNGTGSNPNKTDYRRMLEQELRKGKNRDLNVKQLLASPNNSLVLVSARLPAGALKGEKLDLEITLPQGSRTKSLKGGYLYRCKLHTFERAGNLSLSGRFTGSSTALKGHPVVSAEGPLQVGLGSRESDNRLKQARIWKGGTSLVNRPFHLITTPGNQFARISSLAADRINAAFRGDRGLGNEVAHAKSKGAVMLAVPPQYKRNLRRYLRIVRMIPLSESYSDDAEQQQKSYRALLREDLMDPAQTVIAAMRLEALGTDTVPVLKQGLTSKDPLVRFCSAEALAYLGSATGSEVLAKAVREQPYLRAFALTALASLDEAVCHVKLRDLLWADQDDETRYGAFRALKALDEHDPAVGGKLLDRVCWIHEVAPQSKKPLLHVALDRRAEIVIFGEAPRLKAPYALLAGEFTVTAGEEDQGCTVSYFPRDGKSGPSRRRCSSKLTEVIQAMTAQGANYAEVVELIRQASSTKCLSCRVRHDALPQAVAVAELVQTGKLRKQIQENPDDEKAQEMLADLSIIRPSREHAITPTLFEKDSDRSSWARRRAARELLKKKGNKEERSAFLD